MAIAKIDRQQVIGALRATGSSDPDVLYARKEELLSETKKLKLLGIVPIVVGVILTLSIIGAFGGIPALIFGIFVRKRIRHNITTVDTAYADYLKMLAPDRKPAVA